MKFLTGLLLLAIFQLSAPVLAQKIEKPEDCILSAFKGLPATQTPGSGVSFYQLRRICNQKYIREIGEAAVSLPVEEFPAATLEYSRDQLGAFSSSYFTMKLKNDTGHRIIVVGIWITNNATKKNEPVKFVAADGPVEPYSMGVLYGTVMPIDDYKSYWQKNTWSIKAVYAEPVP